MDIDYTFADGMTLPIKIVTTSYMDDNRKILTFMAVLQDDPVYNPAPPDIPVTGMEIMDVSKALEAVFRKLAIMSGREFAETPRVGIAHYFDRKGAARG